MSFTSIIERNTDVCFSPLNRPTQQCRLGFFVDNLPPSLFQSGLHYIQIFYFECFPQSGTFPTTDRAAGRSGADYDSEDDGTVPRPDGVTLQRSRGAQ